MPRGVPRGFLIKKVKESPFNLLNLRLPGLPFIILFTFILTFSFSGF